MTSILSIANLIIAVQAAFLTLHFLMKKKGLRQLNWLVAIQTLVFGMISLNTYLNLTGNTSMLFEELSNNSLWFIGPAMYLFVRYHEHLPDRKTLYSNLLPYFVPASVGVIAHESDINAYMPYLGLSQILIYVSLTVSYSFRNYRKYPRFFRYVFPSILTFSIVLIVNFVLAVLYAFGIILLPGEVILSFTTLLSIPIFYMAYAEMNSLQEFGIQQPKYQTSHLSDDKLDDYLHQVEEALISQRLFLNASLTLSSLAEKISIPQKYISQAVNQRLKKSFSDYLLELRLQQVEKDLVNPNYQHMTIQGIAQNAGFASLSRFNHHFKQFKGLTPGQYQRQHLSK